MRVIGLTGGIGTGKSEVSKILAQLGAVIIDADKVGHEAYLPNSKTWQDLVKAFGEQILKPNREIDRKKLGSRVFNNPEALKQLNSIVHPQMYRMLQQKISELKNRGVEVVVLEAAVLIEAGWTSLVDEVWVTISSTDSVVERIKARSGLSEDTVRSIMKAQISHEERIKRADVVIDNDGDLPSLRNKVESLWHNRIMERLNSHDQHN